MSGWIYFIAWGVISFCILFYRAKKVRYTKQYKAGGPCLSFEEFVSFYNINPDRWEIKREWNITEERMNEFLIYHSDGEKLIFNWKTNHDSREYLKWAENKKRYEQEMKTAEVLARLTKNVREDVELYGNKAQQQAQETYDRILKMMEKK